MSAVTPTQASPASRRSLRFASLDECLADIDRLIAAEQAGSLSSSGTWTLGQCLNHLATWTNFGYEGFPLSVQMPWFLKPIFRLLRNKFLRDGMRPGVRIPKLADGTLGIEPMTTSDGLAKFKASCNRLKFTAPPYPSPAFGALNQDQAIQLALRHAELHLSFFRTA